MLTTRYILDEAHLSHYDEKLKSWAASQPVKTIPSSLYPWTQTEKAGAVTCWPVGGTPLKPTVDFLFTETGPASGDKAPDNPSTITGVESVKVTRCGKNVCSTKNLYTATPNFFALDTTTGGIKVSGTTGSSATNIEFRSVSNSQNALDGGMLQRGKTYTFSHSGNAPANNYPYFRLYVKETASSGWGSAKVSLANGGSATYSIPSTAYACLVRIDLGYNTTYNCECFVQIEEGSTATAFEPYSGADYPLPLGSTFYGGTLDVASGVMTVTHVAVTPDASTVDISSAPAALPLDYADTFGRTITSADGTSLSVGSAGGTVVYKLAVSQNVQLTPTQILSLAQADKYTPRLNTIYSDQQSVQVGYVKSPIREEFELTQAIVAQGGNI